MNKHASSDEMKKNYDIFLSKINAMEIVASNEFEKGTVKYFEDLLRDKFIQSVNLII